MSFVAHPNKNLAPADKIKAGETKTHRCIDCAQAVEHFESDLCIASGRCEQHAH